MTRMLEGKKWMRQLLLRAGHLRHCFRNEEKKKTHRGLDAQVVCLHQVSNTQKGLTFYDVFGTNAYVRLDSPRTDNLTVLLGESPIYIVAPKGLTAHLRPDPGW